MAKFDRAVQRMKQRTTGKTRREQIRAWELAKSRRASIDPELAKMEAIAKLVLVNLEDPLVDLPYMGIETVEQAQEIVKKAEEVLGPKPPAPEGYDALEHAKRLGLV